MAELHSLPRVPIDDDWHDFDTKYPSLRRKRKIWYSMGCLKEKLKWLKRMNAKVKMSNQHGMALFSKVLIYYFLRC